jgi:hypothetical protein
LSSMLSRLSLFNFTITVTDMKITAAIPYKDCSVEAFMFTEIILSFWT